jgi:hypothetical protein
MVSGMRETGMEGWESTGLTPKDTRSSADSFLDATGTRSSTDTFLDATDLSSTDTLLLSKGDVL